MSASKRCLEMKWYSTPSVSWFFLGRLVSVKEKPDREHLKLRLCESLLELKRCWSEPCSHAATCRSPQHQQLLMTTKPKEVQGKISSLRSPFKKKGGRSGTWRERDQGEDLNLQECRGRLVLQLLSEGQRGGSTYPSAAPKQTVKLLSPAARLPCFAEFLSFTF